MKRALGFCVAAATALFVLSHHADAASTAKDEIASRQYLIGTWSCTHTFGSLSVPYTTTYENVLGNRWIKQTYSFPASKMGPPWQAEFLMGYVEARQAWVRFGALSTGEYYAVRMTDTSPSGSATWSYVSFFPSPSSETSVSDATFIKKSDTEYIDDGPTFREKSTGRILREHNVCRKQ